jgi:hypothetical protein
LRKGSTTERHYHPTDLGLADNFIELRDGVQALVNIMAVLIVCPNEIDTKGPV